MREPTLINPVEHKNWNNLLVSTPGYSFFHTSNWADVLQKSYGYTPFFFTEFSENKITNLLPIMEIKSLLTGKRGVSLPFTDFCEPLAADNKQFRFMLDKAVSFGKNHKWKYLAIRGGENCLSAEQPAEFFYGHKLDLAPGQQQLFRNLRNSTQRNIKKAQKEKVNVSISKSWQSMQEFCHLNSMTRREHGLPPQPFHFFRNVYDKIITKDLGYISTASIKNKTIAANVYFHFGKQVIYKYGASDNAFQHLRANNLVMWEAIKWCADNGFKELCFGRTEPGNSGLRQFKSGWGSTEYFIRYYEYDLQHDAFIEDSSVINPIYKKIFRKIPIPILNLLGRILYRHMG